MTDLRPLKLPRSGEDKFSRTKKAGKVKKIVLAGLLLAVLAFMLSFFLDLSHSTNPVVKFIVSGTALKSTNNQVNVLLLGTAGGTHDGANLTDTIMVVSYNLKTNQVYLISIPRDLWLPSLQSKANAAYEIGLSQNNGLGLAKTIFGNILGLPIHYALRLDFRGFVSAVDNLGGVDITVDKTFDDYNYPIEGKEDDLCGFTEKEVDFPEDQAKQLGIDPGKRKVFVSPDGTIATDSAKEDMGAKYFACRYEHLHFDKGLVHMDGATALKFVRSRHGTNGEASDFARSQRQEKVIQALRGKIISFQTLTNPTKISDLIKTFGKSIDTDISVSDALEFYKLSRKIDKTHSFVLDNSPKSGLPNKRTSLLINPPAGQYGGAYVLVSLDDDFSTIQGYVKRLVTGEITDYEATASARTGN